MKLKMTKEELSWSLYDCANSAYIMMLTAMVPPYIATIGQEFAGLSSAQTTAKMCIRDSACLLRHWNLQLRLETSAPSSSGYG